MLEGKSTIKQQQQQLGGIWVAQSVKPPTCVVISRFVSSSSTLGSVLTAQSLEPAWDSVSPSLSVLPPPPPQLMLCLCLCLSRK